MMKAILGTMNFGPQLNQEESVKMVNLFLSNKHHEIDTAYVYNNGDSEKFLGNALKCNFKSPSVATKVNPRVCDNFDLAAISLQLHQSLRRMDRNSVDILYLHFPDPRTDLEITLEACASLQQQGKFCELGLSNFPAWQVVEAFHICERNGWQPPTVYQGLYNTLSRGVESELLPALDHYGIRFNAYNPLAGGLLTGKYQDITQAPTPGRFTVRPNYKNRYWKDSFFDAMNLLSSCCSQHGISMVNAAFRWLCFHSALSTKRGDGIILGASSVLQLEQNLKAINEGVLPSEIVHAFDEAWEISKVDCPSYFRTSV